jgi:hypothetical protein
MTMGHGAGEEGAAATTDGRIETMMRIGGKDAIGTAIGLQEVVNQKTAGLVSIRRVACGG